jgi:T-complex protein 1 subunit gamma
LIFFLIFYDSNKTEGESQTNVEVKNEDDWEKLLQIEEEAIQKMCADILEFKPDIVVTEKGCSDLAQHYLLKANVSVIRRLRKTDNNRIARATGATIINRTDDIQDSDIGTQCGLFEVRKIGDEYFAFFVECESPKACTILLRGASKDVLNEVERNLQDAMNVARNIVFDPRIVPGGGAVEMAVACHLRHTSKAVEGVQQWPYREVAAAFECIPRTLLQNCGADVIRRITELRAKHATGGCESWGVNGHTGDLADMKDLGIWEPYLVKIQTFKTAVEAACLLLRIDSIVSGVKKAGGQAQGGGGGGAPPPGMGMGM